MIMPPCSSPVVKPVTESERLNSSTKPSRPAEEIGMKELVEEVRTLRPKVSALMQTF